MTSENEWLSAPLSDSKKENSTLNIEYQNQNFGIQIKIYMIQHHDSLFLPNPFLKMEKPSTKIPLKAIKESTKKSKNKKK